MSTTTASCRQRSAERVARIEQVMSEAGVDLDGLVKRLGHEGDDGMREYVEDVMGARRLASLSFAASVAEAFGVSFNWLATGADVLYGESSETVYLDSVPA